MKAVEAQARRGLDCWFKLHCPGVAWEETPVTHANGRNWITFSTFS